MFMDGPTVEVFGNAQDGVGNTMNGGTVVVHGNAGDVLGYGMRGGGSTSAATWATASAST